jgi:membrane associated rhomboid family serine protease
MAAQPVRTRSAVDPAAMRSFLIGTAIGILVVGGFCVGAIVLAGGSLSGALAVGAMCGVIGGLGFGGMLGFVLHQAREEQRRDAARSARSAVGSDG